MCDMQIEFREVGFASKQEDPCSDCGESSEMRLAIGALKLVVQGFQ